MSHSPQLLAKHKLYSTIPIVAVLAGLAVAAFAAGAAQRMSIIILSMGTSLIAAGLYTLIQFYFVGDPVGRIQDTLDSVTGTLRLPRGVTSVYVSKETRPELDLLLEGAKRVTFYGPEGLRLLIKVKDFANGRPNPSPPLELELFLPTYEIRYESSLVYPEELPKNPSQELINTLNSAAGDSDNVVVKRHWLGQHVPTVSVLQIDDNYFQVSLLHPLIHPDYRPILEFTGKSAQKYVKNLWVELKKQEEKLQRK
jgi:hypothetical protein